MEVVAIVYLDFQLLDAECDNKNLGDPLVDEGVWINIGNECFIEELRDFKDVELMQYTGLKDKNGVEIYEGFIIKRKLGTVYTVTYSTKYARFQLERVPDRYLLDWFELSAFDELVEVIGNVYMNPEIIEKAKRGKTK